MSFRLRITLSMIAVIAVLFSIGGAVLISASFSVSLEKEESSVVENTDLMLRMLEMIGENEPLLDEERLVGMLMEIGGKSGFAAMSVTRLADTPEENKTVSLLAGERVYETGNVSFLSETQQAVQGQILVSYPTPENGTHLLVATSLISLGNATYAIHVARDLGRIYHARSQQQTLFSHIYLVLIAVSSVLSFLIATILTRSLRKLGRATREIASGNLSYRSAIRSDDEIGLLSRDFDTMAATLEENVKHLTEETERKERFMGAFTHELKTPMTSIIGYADLLRSEQLSKEEEADALQYIFSEGKRLENMSLKLLDLFVADKGDLSFTAVSPAALAQDVTEHLMPVFSAASVTLSLSAEEGTCLLEEDLTRTLLINLLDNAKKSMPDGGKINVRVTMTPDGCLFTVQDTGRGMEADELSKITEAFYRVDKSRARAEGSAGLGLSLCAKIVELHHGSLRFESAPGKGTTVYAAMSAGRTLEGGAG